MSNDHTQNTYINDCLIIDHHNHTPEHHPMIVGIDEVGRGCLFGQMTVGAVILPHYLSGEFLTLDLKNTPLATLNDSKALSENKRIMLDKHIKNLCHGYTLVDVPAFVIDKIDIYQATLLGMRLTIEHVIKKCQITNPDQVKFLIDGNARPILSDEFKGFQPTIHTIIKGDGIHSSISAASILAKVHRDQSMQDYATHYPKYHLEKHKGYPTSAHKDAIYQYGILPEHRKSFNPIKTILAN